MRSSVRQRLVAGKEKAAIGYTPKEQKRTKTKQQPQTDTHTIPPSQAACFAKTDFFSNLLLFVLHYLYGALDLSLFLLPSSTCFVGLGLADEAVDRTVDRNAGHVSVFCFMNVCVRDKCENFDFLLPF